MSGQQGSRWGSLLSGAVAGLESRLDTILAEDTQASAKARAAEAAAKKEAAEKKRLEVEQGGSCAMSIC
jgi:septal ring factor EnvC (AmiA/AmiB activator)